ncbi:MAG: 6-carboxytetrahydropterin synthase QueD [Actinomycetota bacterium]|nr:6-carboxytetrahydropterin synthase QueD [Actinomycetota bacterium]
MYSVCVKVGFSAAHKLEGYEGRCARIHGHTWSVGVFLMGESLDGTGILFDFDRTREILYSVVSDFDHSFLNELEVFKGKQPTAENVARVVYDRLETSYGKELEMKGVLLHAIFVRESPYSLAVYSGSSFGNEEIEDMIEATDE